jgi:lysophospholipase L1-like esterase
MDADRRRTLGRAVCVSLAVAFVGIFLLLQACFGPAAPPHGPAAAPTRLSSPEALASFFAALDAGGSRRVRILQIGDSHTANDAFSGRIRERLQGKFGAAGRGWLPAGIPFKYYRPALVNVSESGWQHLRPADHAGLALGLDAIAAESQPPDATMAIESTEAAGFDRFAVEFLTRPNGPAFTVAVDGAEPIRVSTAAAAAAIDRFDLPLDRPARHVELRVEGREPVDLLGWAVERQAPGVIYENHGTIGATVDLLGRMTPEAVSFELAERQPALLIVAFGTNEGFDDSLDLERYPARFAGYVETLRRAARGAPVLVLGPPDGNRVGHGCTPTNCGTGGDDCAWHEPAKLAPVRDLQRRVAAQHGWAYWDWFGAMGGACSIDRMASADPPLATRDHVHLTKAGYSAMADLLYGDLMREYERWKASPRTS